MSQKLRVRIARRAGCAVLLAGSARCACADPQYTLLDLGSFGGAASKAYDINNAGLIAGYAEQPSGANVAFRTAAYSAIDSSSSLGILAGGTHSYAYSLNSNGNVAGVSDVPISPSGALSDRAVRYTGAMQSLGTLGGEWSYAYGINDSNQVVGGAASMNGALSPTQAFLYSGTTMYNLGTLGGSNLLDSYAQSINSTGRIVGYSEHDLSKSWEQHAFVWTPTADNAVTGSMSDLGTLGGNYSYAWSINDRNQIAGAATTADDLEYHAVFFANGARADLGTLGGTYSEAFDINAFAAIVGASQMADGQSHAFHSAGAAKLDLNGLIPADSGWVLQSARAVNDSGYIVGWGTNPLGQVHAFLLTPVTQDPLWKPDADGTWSTTENWLFGVPQGPGSVANFSTAITAARTVTVDVPVTVGRISFSNSHSYTLSGDSLITLDSAGAGAAVSVLIGAHRIDAPMQLNESTVFSVLASDASLTVSRGISGAPGAQVIKTGDGTLILSGANTYVGDTLLQGGTLQMTSDSSLGSASNEVIFDGGALITAGPIDSSLRHITVNAAGGTIDTAGADARFAAIAGPGVLVKRSGGNLTIASISAGGLEVQGGKVTLASAGAGGGAGASALGRLTLAGSPGLWSAQLDLTDNDLILHSAADTRADDADRIRNQLRQGANFAHPGAFWTGNGIVTGLGGNGSTTYTAVGLAVNDLALLGKGQNGAIYSSFDGLDVGVNDVLVKYTYFGDADLDGAVTTNDYFQIDNGFLGKKRGWINGDFDYDGAVTTNDYFLIDNAFLGQGAALVPAALGSATALSGVTVPEPASLGVFAFAAAWGAFSRRRRTNPTPLRR
jgi:autotransporter-associated beta strand protein/probable HAF family extracellular repeat protein